jgi:hypothetical protein
LELPTINKVKGKSLLKKKKEKKISALTEYMGKIINK